MQQNCHCIKISACNKGTAAPGGDKTPPGTRGPSPAQVNARDAMAKQKSITRSGPRARNRRGEHGKGPPGELVVCHQRAGAHPPLLVVQRRRRRTCGYRTRLDLPQLATLRGVAGDCRRRLFSSRRSDHGKEHLVTHSLAAYRPPSVGERPQPKLGA